MNPSASIILKVLTLPGIGRKTAFKILTNLKHKISTDDDLIDALSDHPIILRNNTSKTGFIAAFEAAEKILDRSEMGGIKVIGYFDKEYPKLLRDVEDVPLLIHAKGDYTRLNELPSVAVIGTRAPSDHGQKVGVRLGEVFGGAGFNVVSGLAIGCDTAGHTGCLNAGGYTTAVLAHGLDTIYPAANKPLAARILDNGGVLLSEYMIGQKGQPSFFVERDRIQAGLSQAVIVVETDIKGGTMHTVKFAGNAKRIVAAFDHDPKYLYHPKTQGNQYLIKNKTAIPLSNGACIEDLKNQLIEQSGYVVEKPVSPLIQEPKIETPDRKIEVNGNVFTVVKNPETKAKKPTKPRGKKIEEKVDQVPVVITNSKKLSTGRKKPQFTSVQSTTKEKSSKVHGAKKGPSTQKEKNNQLEMFSTNP
ncbi:DNA-processing protein DprA [Spirosoma agri]|uniref:DNA-processing protein DprA n=1 Tax=Spirosoma agri TaxID=1987381 RepID=A0A6M0IRH4_9BACT|nr:DNA-processing protein DprA [Spirosoma agri]NEU70908.1 DNA-processing protein DprA [Spirosoma agri]